MLSYLCLTLMYCQTLTVSESNVNSHLNCEESVLSAEVIEDTRSCPHRLHNVLRSTLTFNEKLACD